MTDRNNTKVFLPEEVHELKTKIDQLKESARLYDLIFTNAIQGIVILKLTGEIVRVNNAFSHLIGYDHNNFKNKNLFDYFPDNFKVRINSLIEKNNYAPIDLIKTYINSKEKGKLSVKIKLQISEYHQEPCFLVFIREVSSQKNSFEQIITSQQRYYSLLDTIEDGFYEVDTKGNLSFFNWAFCRILGYTKKELLYLNYKKIMHDSEVQKAENIFKTAFLTGYYSKAIEFKLLRKDGAIRIAQVTVSLINDQEGWPVGFRGICRDVTELQALQDAKRKFQFMAEEAGDYVSLLNRNYCFDAINKLYADSLPNGKNDVIGKHIREVWGEELYNKAVRKNLDKCFSGQEVTHKSQLNYLKLNQEKGYYKISYLPFRDATNSVTHSLIFIKDITDNKKAEIALKESEARYKRLFNDSVLGIIQTTIEGKIISINPAFAKMFGYEDIESFLNDMKEDISAIYLNPKERKNIIDQHLKSPQPHKKEYYYKRKDGSQFIGLYHNWAVRNNQGQILYLEGFLEDITEQKQAEIKVAQSRRLLLNTLNVLQDLVIVFSPDLKVVMSNWNQEEYPTRGKEYFDFCYDLFRGEKSFCEECRVKKVFESGETISFEEHNIKTDSVYEIHLYPILGENNQVNLVVKHVRDITKSRKAEKERRKLESQLRQVHKMEALGTLAGGIAHDFNNILGVIVGYSELARESSFKGLDVTQELDQILLASARAQKTVKQILTFSRKVDIEFKPCDLNRILKVTTELLKATLPKSIDIELEQNSSLDPINADPICLEQILLNLASNAKDAMPHGGKLFLKTENLLLTNLDCVDLVGLSPGSHVLLEFTDSGIGMNKETSNHIFEPFFTTKKMGKGTGLGLSSVYGIVQSHNASIKCTSSPGKGTTFSIYFPALKNYVPALPQQEPIDQKIPLGNETILIVDDEAQILEIESRLLKSCGYEVIMASSGEEALEQYMKYPEQVDLVILDISMPGMGGHACCEKLIELDNEVKILISSGHFLKQMVQNTLDLGCLGFITKPISKVDFLVSVRKALDYSYDLNQPLILETST